MLTAMPKMIAINAHYRLVVLKDLNVQTEYLKFYIRKNREVDICYKYQAIDEQGNPIALSSLLQCDAGLLETIKVFKLVLQHFEPFEKLRSIGFSPNYPGDKGPGVVEITVANPLTALNEFLLPNRMSSQDNNHFLQRVLIPKNERCYLTFTLREHGSSENTKTDFTYRLEDSQGVTLQGNLAAYDIFNRYLKQILPGFYIRTIINKNRLEFTPDHDDLFSIA